MSNYIGQARTNYVIVEDLEGLKKSLKDWPIKIISDDDGVTTLLSTTVEGGWPTHVIDEKDTPVEFDMEKMVMPYVKADEVLVLTEIGHEKLISLGGRTEAYVRREKVGVETLSFSLSDMYGLAADSFMIPIDSINRID